MAASSSQSTLDDYFNREDDTSEPTSPHTSDDERYEEIMSLPQTSGLDKEYADEIKQMQELFPYKDDRKTTPSNDFKQLMHENGVDEITDYGSDKLQIALRDDTISLRISHGTTYFELFLILEKLKSMRSLRRIHVEYSLYRANYTHNPSKERKEPYALPDHTIKENVNKSFYFVVRMFKILQKMCFDLEEVSFNFERVYVDNYAIYAISKLVFSKDHTKFKKIKYISGINLETKDIRYLVHAMRNVDKITSLIFYSNSIVENIKNKKYHPVYENILTLFGPYVEESGRISELKLFWHYPLSKYAERRRLLEGRSITTYQRTRMKNQLTKEYEERYKAFLKAATFMYYMIKNGISAISKYDYFYDGFILGLSPEDSVKFQDAFGTTQASKRKTEVYNLNQHIVQFIFKKTGRSMQQVDDYFKGRTDVLAMAKKPGYESEEREKNTADDLTEDELAQAIILFKTLRLAKKEGGKIIITYE